MDEYEGFWSQPSSNILDNDVTDNLWWTHREIHKLRYK